MVPDPGSVPLPWYDYPWLAAVVTVGLGFVGWMGRRLVSRVDMLESQKADKSALAELVTRTQDTLDEFRRGQAARDERVEKKLDEGFRSLHERIDRIYQGSGGR